MTDSKLILADNSLKRVIYQLSTAYLLARATQVACELNLGQTIGTAPININELSKKFPGHRGHFERTIKFLAQFNLLTINDNASVSANEFTAHLIHQPAANHTQDSWKKTANLLSYLNDNELPYSNDVHISFSGNQITMTGNPKALIQEIQNLHLISRALHTAAQIDLDRHAGSNQMLNLNSLASVHSHTSITKFLQILNRYRLVDFDPFNETWEMTTRLRKVLTNTKDNLAPALKMVNNDWWNAVTYLDESIKSGRCAFELETKMNFFNYLETHPAQQQMFDIGLSCYSANDDQLIASSTNLLHHPHIIDIGGGNGGLVLEIHRQHHNQVSQLVLYDQPGVITAAQPNLNVCHKISTAPGSFFAPPQDTGIPTICDATYIIKGVLHDFPDEKVVEILQKIGLAMPNNSSLMIVEKSLNHLSPITSNYTSDILMMVLLNGRERSVEEWVSLLAQAGFTHDKDTAPVNVGDFSIIECTKDISEKGKRISAQEDSSDKTCSPTK